MRLNDDQARALGLAHLIPPRPKRAASPDGMNKTERLYATHLRWQQEMGDIDAWAFEPIKLRLAGRTFYTPDFLVVTAPYKYELIEVKGFMREDAAVKIKVAADKYGHLFDFSLVYRRGSGWDIRHVGRSGITPKGGDS